MPPSSIPPERLLAMLAERGAAYSDPEDDEPPMAGPPEPWGVVYAHPNPDGSLKACASCLFYASTTSRCALHGESIPVYENSVCGYHVFGAPAGEKMPVEGLQALDPAGSGLEIVVDGGTSCESCRFYQADDGSQGRCLAVAGYDGAPAPVEAMGCCARWEAAPRRAPGGRR